jgi:hypothetical protein
VSFTGPFRIDATFAGHAEYVVETCWDWAKVEEVRAPTSMGIDSYAPFAVRLAYELVSVEEIAWRNNGLYL